MTNTDWSDVPARLAALAHTDRVLTDSDRIFGAHGHQWQLESPLTPSDLAELESQLRVVLPEEYREFLLHVGRGGVGPAYGLFVLRRVDGRWQWEGDGASLTDLLTLDQPFAHTDAFNPAEGLPEPPDEEAFSSTEEFNRAEDAYWEHHDAIVQVPEHSIGLLYLCHLGCGYQEVLVVSGPARGQMWSDGSPDDSGFSPVLDDDGSRMGFARWYRSWLDDVEARSGVTAD